MPQFEATGYIILGPEAHRAPMLEVFKAQNELGIDTAVLTPDEALKSFKLAPGFRIEAVATDPLVCDPISIQFGPDGRLWVLESGRGALSTVDPVSGRVETVWMRSMAPRVG